MNIEELKSAWKLQQQNLDNEHVDELANRVRSRAGVFEKKIFTRDMIESVAAVFVLICFTGSFFSIPHPLGKLGSAVVVVGAIEVLAVLHFMRRYGKSLGPELSMREYCLAEARRVSRQIVLLKNISWWYSGPILVGCALIAFGTMPPQLATICCIGYGLFGVFIHWINRRAVRTDLLPLHQELMQASESFNENGKDFNSLQQG